MSVRRWRQIDLGVWEEVEADGPWCLGGDGGRWTLISGRRWRQMDLGVWEEVEADGP